VTYNTTTRQLKESDSHRACATNPMRDRD